MTPHSHITEKKFSTFNGWALLGLFAVFVILAGALVYHMATATTPIVSPQGNVVPGYVEAAFSLASTITVGVLAAIVAIFWMCGFYTNSPLQVAIITLAGKYKGVDGKEGFRWVLPWYGATRVSKRLLNMNIPSIRVNDKLGNPIDIGAVVVCKVHDAAKSSFLVEDAQRFVLNQAEVALRVLASDSYYDATELQDKKEDPAAPNPPPARTLIENREEAGKDAADILSRMIGDIGVEIQSVNITHLSYAPEIASVMLRRQAASAVIAARKSIVEGAVQIVKDAVDQIPGLKSDDDRKGAIAANLLTVLVGEQGVTPVINVSDTRG